jgi:hypothetical protein
MPHVETTGRLVVALSPSWQQVLTYGCVCGRLYRCPFFRAVRRGYAEVWWWRLPRLVHTRRGQVGAVAV